MALSDTHLLAAPTVTHLTEPHSSAIRNIRTVLSAWGHLGGSAQGWVPSDRLQYIVLIRMHNELLAEELEQQANAHTELVREIHQDGQRWENSEVQADILQRCTYTCTLHNTAWPSSI